VSADALAGLGAEIAAVTALLEGLSPGAWERPTRCPPMTVRVMAGHLLRQARQIVEYPRGGDPDKDAASYYRYDPPAVGAGVLARAQEMAASLDPQSFVPEWKRRWAAALDEAGTLWEADPVVRTPFGGIRLREYLRTRCLEACVHHMDLRDALGLDPGPTPGALAVTLGLLEQLLGAPRARTGLDDIPFVLAGTGRRPLTEGERDTLGQLAKKFPLLS
jgi:uncharacterized protein (TIGR03083 family)